MYFGLKEQRIFAPPKLDVIKIFVQFYCSSSYWIDFYQNNFVLKQRFFQKTLQFIKGSLLTLGTKMNLLLNLAPLYTFVSKKVISVSDISANNT